MERVKRYSEEGKKRVKDTENEIKLFEVKYIADNTYEFTDAIAMAFYMGVEIGARLKEE